MPGRFGQADGIALRVAATDERDVVRIAARRRRGQVGIARACRRRLGLRGMKVVTAAKIARTAVRIGIRIGELRRTGLLSFVCFKPGCAHKPWLGQSPPFVFSVTRRRSPSITSMSLLATIVVGNQTPRVMPREERSRAGLTLQRTRTGASLEPFDLLLELIDALLSERRVSSRRCSLVAGPCFDSR